MWHSLKLLVILATSVSIVSPGNINNSETIIVTSAKAASSAVAANNGGNGAAVVAASSALARSTVIKFISSRDDGGSGGDKQTGPFERTSGLPDTSMSSEASASSTVTELSTKYGMVSSSQKTESEPSDQLSTSEESASSSSGSSDSSESPVSSESSSSSESSESPVSSSSGNYESTTQKERTATGSTTLKSSEQNCRAEASELYISAVLAYTGKLLDVLSKTNARNNVLCSGSGVLYIMAQIVLLAKGKMKKELLNALHFKNTDQILCYLPQIHADAAANHRNIEYNVISTLYADVECRFTDHFVNSTKNIYSIKPETLKFSSSESARHISETVAKTTNNIIPNYFKSSTLSSTRCSIMVDAHTYKGAWESPFNPKNTADRNFFCGGKIVKRPTMYQTGRFLYTESKQLKAKILKMEYEGKDFDLAIFLPYEKDGLRDLTKRLRNYSVVISTLQTLSYKYMDIYVPKFNISGANKLKYATETTQVTEIFNNETSGLEDISDCKSAYVSQIFQKVFIQVDESGMGDCHKIDNAEHEETSQSSGNPAEIRIDHPFAFYLFYKKIAILAGIYAC